MALTLKELCSEMRQLRREQAAELIDLLLIDTFSEIDPVIDEVWGREIDRRLAVLESGKVQGIPVEEVMANAREIVDL